MIRYSEAASGAGLQGYQPRSKMPITAPENFHDCQDADHRLRGLEQTLRREVMRCIRVLERQWEIDLPRPDIRIDLRGTAAGQAQLQNAVLRFNSQMLAEYGGEFIDSTVPHEVAHLAVYRIFGRRARPHGQEWRQLMLQLGASPERCHQYRVQPTRRLKRFIYRCSCRLHRVTSIRHHRAQRGTRYVCTRCRGRLRYVKAPPTREQGPRRAVA